MFEKINNYDDIKNKHLINFDNIDRYIEWLESETRTHVLALGTGGKNGERILKKQLVKAIK